MKVPYKFLVAIATVATVIGGTGGVAYAKGGDTSSSSGVPRVATTLSCADYAVQTNADLALGTSGDYVYPLTNDRFPGGVAVLIGTTAAGAPYAKGVCTDSGWTVQSKSVTGGMQLQFNYNNERAIDFKYVLGKTDIRNY